MRSSGGAKRSRVWPRVPLVQPAFRRAEAVPVSPARFSASTRPVNTRPSSGSPSFATNSLTILLVGDERLGHDDVRAANLRTLCARDAEIAVRFLRAHPKRELRDLRAARVDIHAVEVVREDQAWNGLSERIEARVVLRERAGPSLRSSGSPDRRAPPRRSRAADRRHREGSGRCRRQDRARGCRADPSSRAARIPRPGLRTMYSHRSASAVFAAAHLVPDAAERVVGEELDDVARREELVADRQLAAVARRLALLAHLPPLVLAVEELVDPADRLVLAPHVLQIVAVERSRAARRTRSCAAKAPKPGRGGRTEPSPRSKARRRCSRCRADSRCRRAASAPGAKPQNSLTKPDDASPLLTHS